MASAFDLFKVNLPPGGLLGVGQLTPEEEEQKRAEEEAAAAQAAAEAAAQTQAAPQSDPLAPLATDQPLFDVRSADDEPAKPDQEPPDQPLDDQNVFQIRSADEGQKDEAPFAVRSADTKGEEQPAFGAEPLFHVKSADEEQPPALATKPATPDTKKVEPSGPLLNVVNDWVAQARAKAKAQIAAEAAKPHRNIDVSPAQAVYDQQLYDAVNSPELWQGTKTDFKALEQGIYEGLADQGIQRRSGTDASWDEIVKYRENPLNMVPSPLQPVGKETKEEASPEGAPTLLESVKTGGLQQASLSNRAIQAVQEAVGADKAAARSGQRAEYYEGLTRTLPQGINPTDIKSIGDTIQWVKQTVGQQGVMMAAPLGGAAIGRVVAGSLGASLGAFGPSWLLGTGEIQQGNKAINPEQKASLSTLVGGAAVAALDSVLPEKMGSSLVKTFGKDVGEEMSRRILLLPADKATTALIKRWAAMTAKGVATEGSTEFAQSIIGNMATAYQTNTNLPPDLLKQALNDGLTGALAGGIFGGSTSAAEIRAERNAPIKELAGAEFTTTPQQQALDVVQQREAAARGQTVGTPADVSRKSDARPTVMTPEERAVQARPFLVRPTPTPVNARGQSEKFTIPNAPITSKFGPRHTFLTANGQHASSNHAGIDLGLPAGANAPAGASGVVVSAGPRGGYGNQVVIQHADGTTSSYSHLAKIGVERGQEVAQGQSVGKVGKTGNATGPHLHLERRDRQGRPVNPLTGGVIQTAQNPDTGEFTDDTDWEPDQTPVDTAEAPAQEELDQAYTEATGQQWDPADFEPPEAVAEATMAQEAETPAAAPVEPPPEPRATRHTAASEALDEGRATDPAETAASAVASLDEAKAANPARQALTDEQVAPTETRGIGEDVAPAEAAAPPQGGPDYSQAQPGEQPVYAQDEGGNITPEVSHFQDATGAVREVGEAPPATDAAAVAPSPEPSPPPTPAAAPVAEAVATEPAAVAWTPPDEHGGQTLAERQATLATLPLPKSKNEAINEARSNGQQAALGLEPAPPLTSMSKAERTAFNVGLKEANAAVAKVNAGKIVSAVSGAEPSPTTLAKPVSSEVTAPAPVGKKIPALKERLAAAKEQAQPETKQAEPAPIPTMPAKEPVGAEPAKKTVAKAKPAKESAGAKARRKDIERTTDRIEEKFFDLENDGTKGALKTYLKGLVSKGVLDKSSFDSLDYMWKDRDMGVEDVTSEVRGYIDEWKDNELAALSQPVTKRRPSEEKPSEKTPEKAAPGPVAGTERGRPEAHDKDGEGGLQGTGERTRPDLNKDGTYSLQHFGPEGLTETDPAMWGKSRSLSREERSYMAKAPARTYFGLHTGEPGGYKREFGDQVPRYDARIPAAKMYDVIADPDKLWVKGYPEDGEHAIKNAGYTGYWYKNRELGLVGVVFDKVPVTRTEAAPKAEPKTEQKPPAAKARVATETREAPAEYPNAPKAQPGKVTSYGHVTGSVETAVRKVLKSMGLEGRADLAVQLLSQATARELNIDDAGQFERTEQGDLIIRVIALANHDAGQTARHEIIHWMRDTGVISPSEWRTLAAWARSNKSLMTWAEANYAAEESRDGIVEEAVAEGFSRWHGGDPLMVRAASGPVKGIFDYLRATIQKVAVYLGGGGITRGQLNDAVRLMTDIQSGEQVRKFDASKTPQKFKAAFGRKPVDVSISSALIRGKISVAEAHGLKVMDRLGVAKGQVAWHGTPQTAIERFLNQYINTGEKAQAFGWGLYFAQKKSVADWYRVKLSMDTTLPATRIVQINGQPIIDFVGNKLGDVTDPKGPWATAAYEVASRIHKYLTDDGGRQYNGWLDSLHVAYDKEVPGVIYDAEQENDADGVQRALDDQIKVAQVFTALQMKTVSLDHGPTAGAVYKVELPDDHKLLNLDKPLGEQSTEVTAALTKVRGQLEKAGVLDDYEENMNGDFWEWTGRELQMVVLKRLAYDDAFPAEVSPDTEAALEDGDAAKAASMWLKELGVPGSRFLDRDSRDPNQTSKTHNYVMFDDNQITIAGKEVPVAMGRSMIKRRVVRNPQPVSSILSDPTNPDPGAFRKIHDQTMAMLGKLGALGTSETGDVDAADTLIDAFKRKVVNRYQQVIKTQARAAEQLGLERLPSDMNPMEMITADERGYKLEHLLDNQVKPLAKFMAKSNISLSDLGLYLYARHAPARNERVARENPEFRKSGKPGSGMSDAEAAQIMQDFAANGQINDLQSAAVYIDRMIEMAQQERLQSGLLTQDALDAGFQPQDHYVPLRGNENVEPELEMGFPVQSKGGGGFSVRGSESHPMYGRESRANLEQIVGYTITQAQEAIDRSYRNTVAKSLHDMFSAVPDSNFVQIDRVKKVATWNAKKGEVEYQMQTRITDPEEVARTVFWKDGDTLRKMTFNNQNPSAMRFVKAIKNLDPVQVGQVGRIMSTFTKLWSRANTQWNVDFILANAVKDVQTGVINAGSLDKKGLRSRMLKNLASLGPLRGAMKGEFGKAGEGFAAADVWHQVYAEFEANGGKLHYGQTSSVEDALKDMRAEFKHASQSNANPLKAGRKVLGLIDALNGSFENMTRLAAYKALRDMNVEPKQAAVAVRELTTNFQQHGEWGPKVNAFYGFANASIIGGARFGATIAKSPLTITGLLALGAMSDLLNKWLDPDQWDQYTEEEKDSQFMLMLPDWVGFDLKMPVGYGLNSFVTTGRKFSELWRGKKDKEGDKLSPLQAASDVAMSFVNAFSPVSGATLANIVAPSIADPFVDAWQNKDNWGKPVYKSQYDKKKPASQASFEKTSQFWKSMAEGMNAFTGGNEVLKGYIDLPPDAIAHVASEEAGGVGRSVMRAIKTGTKLATGDAISPNDIPVVRRFAGQPFGAGSKDEERLGSFYDKFYDAKDTVDNAKAMVQRYGLKSPEYREFYNDNKQVIEAAPKIKIADTRLRKLKSGYNALEHGQNDAGGLTPKQQKAIYAAGGGVLPTGKPLTEEQAAKSKAKIDAKRLVLADEFNVVWKAKVLGVRPESQTPAPAR